MSIAKKTAYIVFSLENRNRFKRENPDLSNSEILGVISNKWKSLSETEKTRYKRLADIHNGDEIIRYTINRPHTEILNIMMNGNKKIEKNTFIMKFSDISDYLDDDNKCLVCYAKIANVIFLPCKHRVSCKDCCEKLQKTDNRNKCIKCRQDVEKFLL